MMPFERLLGNGESQKAMRSHSAIPCWPSIVRPSVAPDQSMDEAGPPGIFSQMSPLFIRGRGQVTHRSRFAAPSNEGGCRRDSYRLTVLILVADHDRIEIG